MAGPVAASASTSAVAPAVVQSLGQIVAAILYSRAEEKIAKENRAAQERMTFADLASQLAMNRYGEQKQQAKKRKRSDLFRLGLAQMFGGKLPKNLVARLSGQMEPTPPTLASVLGEVNAAGRR